MEMIPLVFLSSTSDMQAEYEALDAHLPRHDLLLFWFKLEGAQGAPPISHCKEKIAKCDVFLIVLGEKYGSLVPGEKVSFVEAELDNADLRHDLDIMPFIKNAATRDPAQQKLVDRVCTGKWTMFFNTPEEFADKARMSLLGWLARVWSSAQNRAGDLLRRSRQVSLGAAISFFTVMSLISILAILGKLTPSSAIVCNVTLACGVAMALVLYVRFHDLPGRGEKHE